VVNIIESGEGCQLAGNCGDQNGDDVTIDIIQNRGNTPKAVK
jgi:hypothetical protein